MFGRLMPREGRFFDDFCELADQGVLAAEGLAAMLKDMGHADEYARRVKDIEHHADDITHRTLALLHSTFITPIDRNDIHSLVQRLDDVVDYVDATAQRIVLYDLRAVPDEGIAMADLSVAAAKDIKAAVGMLSNLKNADAILEKCIAINDHEAEADRFLRIAMAQLFRGETDLRELIKLKDAYELLETVTDRCEDVATIIQGIVLEYA